MTFSSWDQDALREAMMRAPAPQVEEKPPSTADLVLSAMEDGRWRTAGDIRHALGNALSLKAISHACRALRSEGRIVSELGNDSTTRVWRIRGGV